VTCDNALNNDTITTELDDILPAFNGINRTCCFLHIVNLVMKSLLRQFEAMKKLRGDNTDLSKEEQEQLQLKEDLETEELITIEKANEDEDEDGADNDDTDGWVDKTEGLIAKEKRQLQWSITPVRHVLAKVSNEKTHLCSMSAPALEGLLQDYSFDDPVAASMKGVCSCIKTFCPNYAAGYIGPVELNL